MLADTLTVEPSKVPGRAFCRKALKYVQWVADCTGAATNSDYSAFKIQTHKMFLDTSFNSRLTVLSTIYQNFIEVAMKYCRYAKCMGGGKHPHSGLLIGKFSQTSHQDGRAWCGRQADERL